MADTAPKKQRAKRRNYQQELSDLRSYVSIKIEVLTSLMPDDDGTPIADGIAEARIAELEAVRARLGD